MALAQISDLQVQQSLNVGSSTPQGVSRVYGGKNILVSGATLQPVINFNVLNANAQDGNIAFYDINTGTFVCDTGGNLYWEQSANVLYVNNLEVFTNLNLGDGHTPTITDSVNLTGTSGQVLTSLGGTSGVKWQSPLAGVTSIGGGANIVIGGTSAVPLVSVSVPSATSQDGSIPFYDFTAGKLIATGTTAFYWDNSSATLYANNIRPIQYLDNTGSAGTSGQALISTGSGAQWSALSGVSLVSAGRNIEITGTSASPTINLTTSIVDSTSTSGSAYQILTASASGGSLTWADPSTFITAGAGITVSLGSPTTIVNTGLLGITAGTGLTVTTGQNPTMSISLSGGSGISISGATITNTGTLSVVAGTGISVITGQNPTIANTGTLSVSGGSGITVSSGQNPTITNSGILSITAGSGVSVSTLSGVATVNATGVLGLSAGSGISVSSLSGAYTVSATGVLGLSAGTAISITSSLGVYTINATGAVTSIVNGTNMGTSTLISGTLTLNASTTPSFTSVGITGTISSALLMSGNSGGILMNGTTPSINMSGSGASINITDVGGGTKLGITSGNIVLTNGYIQPRYIYDLTNSTLSGSSAYVLTSLGASGWKWLQPPYSVFSKTSSTTTLSTSVTGTAQLSGSMLYTLPALSTPVSVTGALTFTGTTPVYPSTCLIYATIYRASTLLVTLPLTSIATVNTAQTYSYTNTAPIAWQDTGGSSGVSYVYSIYCYYVASGTVTAPTFLLNSTMYISVNQ